MEKEMHPQEVLWYKRQTDLAEILLWNLIENTCWNKIKIQHTLCHTDEYIQMLFILKKEKEFIRKPQTCITVVKYLTVKFSSSQIKSNFTCKNGITAHLTHHLFQDDLLFFNSHIVD